MATGGRKSRVKAVAREQDDGLYVPGEDEEIAAKISRPAKKTTSRHAPGRRGMRTTSRFRGVTHHCRTQRWEAHIWEAGNPVTALGQEAMLALYVTAQAGKQIYLGGFDEEDQAALAYDLAALKFRGEQATTNFDIGNYAQELAQFDDVTKEEVVQNLRRQSKGYQKTSSQFRGVTRHQKGKWEARIGQMVGKKYKYLGLYATEIEAAQAYDRESVSRRGLNAITNFDLGEYAHLLSAEDLAEARMRGLICEDGGEAATDAPDQAHGMQSPGSSEAEGLHSHGEEGAWQGSAEQIQQQLLLLKAAGASSSQAHLQLYGQHSLPALPSFTWGPAPPGGTADLSLQQQQQAEAFDWAEAGAGPDQTLAPLQGKADCTPCTDGITPKSVFNWQPQSGTASPTTPHPEHLQQLGPDAGMHLHLLPTPRLLLMPSGSSRHGEAALLPASAGLAAFPLEDDWLLQFAASQLSTPTAATGAASEAAQAEFEAAAGVRRAESRSAREMEESMQGL